LNGLFREEDYPSTEKLRAKFGVKLEVLPIPSVDDFRVTLSEAFRPFPGASLGWVPGTLYDPGVTIEENLASLERVGHGASKAGTVRADVTREGSIGTRQTTTYHLEVRGQGSRGSVDSTTDLVLTIDPKDPLVTGPTELTELHIPKKPGDPAGLYPIVLYYTRTLYLTDVAGRKCAVKVQGRVNFTRDQFSGGLISPPTSFDSLIHLKGDGALMRVKLQGSSLVQQYNAQVDAGSEQDLSTLSRTVALYLEMPPGNSNRLSKEEGRFVEPNTTAGDQFQFLETFLESADTEEMGRRVMDDLNRLSAHNLPPPTKSAKDDSGDGGDLPGWLKGALLGLGIGLAIVGAIFLVAAAFGVSIAVAAAAVGATIVTTLLIYAVKNRYEEAKAAGISNPLSILSAAILDIIGSPISRRQSRTNPSSPDTI